MKCAFPNPENRTLDQGPDAASGTTFSTRRDGSRPLVAERIWRARLGRSHDRFIFEQETSPLPGTLPPRLAFSVTMVGPVIYTFRQ